MVYNQMEGNAMAVTYQDWLKSVKQFLASRRPDVKFDQLDPNHLYSSFQAGLSPIDFVQQGQFRFNPAVPPAPAFQLPQGQVKQATNPLHIVLFVILFGVIGSCIGCGLFLGSVQSDVERKMASTPTCSQVQAAVQIGMTTSQVTEAIGGPDNVQEMNRLGVTTRYWYYRCRDGQIQIVFDYGITVTSINRY